MRPAAVLLALALLGLPGCGGTQPTPTGRQGGEQPSAVPATPAPDRFAVSSSAFADNSQIPDEYSCEGRNIPPPLRWQHVPPETESLAVVVDDPDAPAGLYVHWVVTGIPANTTEISAGALPPTAVVSLNSNSRAEYLGPCPPAGSVHHYRFKLYALSQPLTLLWTTPAPESTTTIAGLSVAVTDTVGLFGH